MSDYSDGSIRAVCCDDEGHEKETAGMVAGWIKRGLTVERVTGAEYSRRIERDLAKGEAG